MSKRALVGVRNALPRSWRSASVITILLAAAGCGGSTATPTPTTLHAEVGDAGGDAVPDPADRITPDLTHGTVDVSAGNITLTVQFASGTLDRLASSLTLELDTDQNPSTGIRTADGLGVEYALDMRGIANQAIIMKSVPTGACTASDPCYIMTGVAPLSVLADQMVVTMPLSLIGSTDGRLNYRARAYDFKPNLGPKITDVMPDIALGPAHVP
jgi:hypothetical protein